MNKKFAIAASTLLLAVALTACGSSGKDSAAQGEGAPANASSGDVQAVTLKATNFEFDQKEIRVKKGQTVKLTLENSQGMHGVEIPDLKVKLDSPGSTEFVADKEGTFEFKCSIMCGAGHNDMVGKIIVE
ncbi:cupredoxin domain-containing protein [Paenibacillus apiarius]|uniref:cupredoxin domain-containing protein n=1 Tax=Paenibacillus apiarius TaxID=46240 RepID=UPI003B3A5CF6